VKTITLYDLQTGLMGPVITMPDRRDPAAPKGFGMKLGRHDPLSRRVDVSTGEVIDYQPPAPSEQYRWDTVSRRWVPTPEAEAMQLADRLARRALVKLEERSGPRAVREGLIAALPDGPQRQRLLELDAEAAVHRKNLAPQA